jgi:5-methylcytosine-specific restriction endonuclease McrA
MSKSWEKGSDTRWSTFRIGILERDHWLCTIRDQGCTEVATQVDHIIPLEMGGEKYDPLNCRASCAPCNQGRKKVVHQYEPPYKTVSSW